MSRTWPAFVLVILALHIVGVPAFGHSFAGSLLANLFQIAATMLALLAAALNWRRATGVSKHFWTLATLGLISWTCADLAWTYYENVLRVPIPIPSPFLFLYHATIGFLAMALLLDGERDAQHLSVQTLLDQLQVGLIFFFLYLDLYYIPAYRLDYPSFLVKETTLGNIEDLLCLALGIYRFSRTRSAQLRELYRGLILFLGVFIVCTSAADYGEIYKGISGSWFDLGWTIPFLVAALLAASWKPLAQDELAPRRKTTWTRLALTNFGLAFVPLYVMFRSTRLPGQWRDAGIAIFAISALCYAARLVLYQFEQIRAAEALNENSRLLQAVSDTTTEAIYVKDLSGKYLLINNAGAQAVGRPIAEIIGRDDTALFPPDTALAIMTRDREILASGTSQTYEERTIANSESRVYLSTKGPYRDQSGNTIGLIGISVDITDRHRAEQYFRSLVQNSSDVITIIEADGTIRYQSPSIHRILGYSQDELIGKNVFEYFEIEDLPKLRARMEELLRHPGATSSSEFRFRHADGSWVSLWGIANNLLNDPNVRGVVVNSRSVAEEKISEKARIDAEARYRTLVEQLAAVTYIARLGLEGEWLYVSPQIWTMLGYTPEEWLADPTMWLNRIHPDDRALVASAEDAAIGGRPFRAQYRLLHREGRVVWVDDNASVMRDADGNNLLHGVLLDVTERKSLETELQQAQKMQAVGQLAGGIAHDFNNILTVILGYAQILLDRQHPDEEFVRRSSEQIRNSAERAAGLTRQLLAFGRKQVLQPRLLNFNHVLTGLDKMLRRLITENIHISTTPAPDLGSVKADPAQIEQVILNLAINARDAMPNGGHLTIETANVDLDEAYAAEHETVRPGPYVMLAVSDTGSGMNAATQARIFEPFFTTKELGKGTGLGLATVYGIVKQSGGYIWVYSEPGRGSTFKVYLPRVGAAADISAGRPEVSTVRGDENILLVEDDRMVRNLAESVLKACGYNVIVPEHLEEVESLCSSYPSVLHLLLTDVVMPGMSGLELAGRLAPMRPQMKVVYMSGYTENALLQQDQFAQGIHLLQKPFTPAALAKKVREVLDEEKVSVRGASV
jgi:two-component system cell cycle sensor histidine kinase/response regulator CckA